MLSRLTLRPLRNLLHNKWIYKSDQHKGYIYARIQQVDPKIKIVSKIMADEMMVKELEQVVVRFSGDSGDGMQLAG